MLRSAASKVMWVGRATVFLVGLAVILALLFGAASIALAKNGNPWILGKGNVATAVTSLGGKQGVNGPMLRIVNNNADSNDTALALKVQAGEPPLRVNSDAKVPNLNADKLDGKEASDFLGTDGKAADSEQFDGKDSTEYLTRRTYFKEITRDNSAGATTRVGFVCDPGLSRGGDMVLSGGYSGLSPSEGTVVTSRPISSTAPNGTNYGWELVWENASPNLDSNVTVTLLCADFPPLRN